MAKGVRVDAARVVFAKVTPALENAVLIAAEGQATSDLTTACRSCDSLIAYLESCLRQLRRLKRQLG